MTMFCRGLRVRRPRRNTMDPKTVWPNRVRTALLALALISCPAAALAADVEQAFEVWLVDQSNSPGKTYGGKISIYDGGDISGSSAANAVPSSTIDLGGDTAALC